jgi:hypothetical protein
MFIPISSTCATSSAEAGAFMRLLARVAMVAVLASCGGGGGDGGGGGTTVDEAPGGLWSGTLVIDGQAGRQDLVGISTDDGRFRFISVDTEGQFSGMVAVAGTRVTGSGKAFAPPGFTWRDGSTVATLTMTGTLRERRSMEGAWTSATGESGTFALAYDPDYEKDSSLALLVGVWTVYDDNLNPFATFTIEADGQFSGQNAAGCTSVGRISIIDPAFDVYGIASSISNCAIAGDYEGLGVLGSIASPDDVFLFSVNNDTRALLLGLER